MGKRKRKSRNQPKPKKAQKLDTDFCCPFCNYTKSVTCTIDMRHLIGEAVCDVCHERYCTKVNALTEPIDIYSEWIDECENVNKVEDDADEL